MIKHKQRGYFQISAFEMGTFMGFFFLGGLTFVGSIIYGVYWLFNHVHFL